MIKLGFIGKEGAACLSLTYMDLMLEGPMIFDMGTSYYTQYFKKGLPHGEWNWKGGNGCTGGSVDDGAPNEAFTHGTYLNGKETGKWYWFTQHCTCDPMEDEPPLSTPFVHRAIYSGGEARSSLSAWLTTEGGANRWRLRHREDPEPNSKRSRILHVERSELRWGTRDEGGADAQWICRDGTRPP
jgi:hypothetical protein